MNEQKQTQTVIYFAERISYFQNLAQTLDQDNRADEAIFAKVKMNVYDIFKTIFSVAVKTAGHDEEKAVKFFMSKLQQIPENWRTALNNAETHGETEKAHIERVKLEAVEAIKNEFTRIWEENT